MKASDHILVRGRKGLHSDSGSKTRPHETLDQEFNPLDGHRLRAVLAAVLEEQLEVLEQRLLLRILGNQELAPESSPGEVLLTEREVASMIQCHQRTIRRLERSGEIPSALRIGGSKRWRASDLDDWLGSQAGTRKSAR